MEIHGHRPLVGPAPAGARLRQVMAEGRLVSQRDPRLADLFAADGGLCVPTAVANALIALVARLSPQTTLDAPGLVRRLTKPHPGLDLRFGARSFVPLARAMNAMARTLLGPGFEI